MAGIPTKRFDELSDDYNTAIADIKKSDPAKILNSASNTISTKTSGFLGLMSKISQNLNINKLYSAITDGKRLLENNSGLTKLLGSVLSAQAAYRQGRGLLKSIIDVNQKGIGGLDKFLSSLYKDDPAVKNVMKILGNLPGQKNKSPNVTTGKPFKPTLGLANGAPTPPGAAQPSIVGSNENAYKEMSVALEEFTGSPQPYVVNDRTLLLQQSVNLANMAYEAGVPGVLRMFQNMPNMPPEVFGRLVDIVMTEQSSNGNTAAILDMSVGPNAVMTDRLSPITASPLILTDTIANFKLPANARSNGSATLVEALFDTATVLDPNWRLSEDGIPSTKHVDNASPELVRVLQAKAVNNTFDLSNLDIRFASNDDLLLAAMIANNPANLAQLRALAGGLTCSAQYCKC